MKITWVLAILGVCAATLAGVSASKLFIFSYTLYFIK